MDVNWRGREGERGRKKQKQVFLSGLPTDWTGLCVSERRLFISDARNRDRETLFPTAILHMYSQATFDAIEKLLIFI